MPEEIKFGDQAAAWLVGLAQRKRKLVSAATLSTYGCHVRKLTSLVGVASLSTINNGFLRDLVNKLDGAPKTINDLVVVVKAVVGSAVDPTSGEPLFPRTWRASMIDAPSIVGQSRPMVSDVQIERAIRDAATHEQQLLFAILGGTGLRISEALALHLGPVDDDQTSFVASEAVIHVRSSLYKGTERRGILKTAAAKRDVDLDPSLADAISKYATAQNIAVGQLIFRSSLKKFTKRLAQHKINGFHAFRRYRITRLENANVPRGLFHFWAGHAGSEISDLYVKSAEDIELRKSWASKVRLGFSLEKVGHPAPSLPKPPKRKSRTLSGLVKADRKSHPIGKRYRARKGDLPAELFAPTPAPVVSDAPATPEQLEALARAKDALEALR